MNFLFTREIVPLYFFASTRCGQRFSDSYQVRQIPFYAGDFSLEKTRARYLNI
jgi:hypothetical protein